MCAAERCRWFSRDRLRECERRKTISRNNWLRHWGNTYTHIYNIIALFAHTKSLMRCESWLIYREAFDCLSFYRQKSRVPAADALARPRCWPQSLAPEPLRSLHQKSMSQSLYRKQPAHSRKNSLTVYLGHGERVPRKSFEPSRCVRGVNWYFLQWKVTITIKHVNISCSLLEDWHKNCGRSKPFTRNLNICRMKMIVNVPKKGQSWQGSVFGFLYKNDKNR
jgi:hypothetical protein